MVEMRIKAWMTIISLVNLGTLAGGPADYESIKANSAIIGDEIKITLPPLSAVYLLVEPGTKTLPINNEVTSTGLTRAEDNITDLAPGVYFINFRNDKQSIINKLIIK
jgi:hypothetical protein